MSATAAVRYGSKCSRTTARWNPISAVGWLQTREVGESGPKNPWSTHGRAATGLGLPARATSVVS